MPDDSKKMSIASALTNIDPCWASQLKARRASTPQVYLLPTLFCSYLDPSKTTALSKEQHPFLTSSDRDQRVHSASSTATPPKEQDPFMFFSDEERRMAYLKGRSTSNESSSSVVRKKRITFELHPDVIIEDLLSDMGYE